VADASSATSGAGTKSNGLVTAEASRQTGEGAGLMHPRRVRSPTPTELLRLSASANSRFAATRTDKPTHPRRLEAQVPASWVAAPVRKRRRLELRRSSAAFRSDLCVSAKRGIRAPMLLRTQPQSGQYALAPKPRSSGAIQNASELRTRMGLPNFHAYASKFGSDIPFLNGATMSDYGLNRSLASARSISGRFQLRLSPLEREAPRLGWADFTAGMSWCRRDRKQALCPPSQSRSRRPMTGRLMMDPCLV